MSNNQELNQKASQELSGFLSFESFLIYQRYSIRDPKTGERLEKTYEDIIDRIYEYLCGIDFPISFDPINEALRLVRDRRGTFATPALMNLGNKYVKRKGYYSCFPLGPIPDSTQEIFDYLRTAATVFQYAGGVGLDFSPLRPRSSPVDGSQGESSGPCEFIALAKAHASAISQGGKRRGAMLAQMDWTHEDILEFVNLKRERRDLAEINISVNAFGDFWKEKDLIREIAQSMWISGDPGLLFIDAMSKNSPYPELVKPFVKYVNPCAEYVSIPFCSCNLLTGNAIACDDMTDFEKLGYYLTHLGNAILWITLTRNGEGLPKESMHYERFYEVLNTIRPVGIGLSGIAEHLYLNNISYMDTEYWLQMYAALARGTLTASNEWAKATGESVEWDPKYKAKHLSDINYNNLSVGGTEFWNTSTLCQAPAGSVSQFLRCISTGIEPLTSFSVKRQFMDTETNQLRSVTLDSVIPISGRTKPLEAIPWEDQLELTAVIQKCLHTSASKTINVPNETTVDEIEELIYKAQTLDLKGLTVFREGCALESIVSCVDNKDSDGVIELPDFLYSKKYKFKGQSSVYVFITYDPEFPKEPREVFIEVGKSGTRVNSLCNAIARQASLALRSGTRPKLIIKSLKGDEDGAFLTNSRCGRATSISDAVALALSNFVGETDEVLRRTYDVCRVCHKFTLERTGNCKTCNNCGYTSC